jgi:hypothetical protein
MHYQSQIWSPTSRFLDAFQLDASLCLHSKTLPQGSGAPICIDLFVRLLFLWSMFWDFAKVNVLRLKRLHKSE